MAYLRDFPMHITASSTIVATLPLEKPKKKKKKPPPHLKDGDAGDVLF